MMFKDLRKKLWVCVLVVCLLLTGIPTAAFAAGSGEAEPDAFVIPGNAVYLSTPEDILKLAENCISDAWSRDQVFVLKNDIDLSGTEFAFIPTFGSIRTAPGPGCGCL